MRLGISYCFSVLPRSYQSCDIRNPLAITLTTENRGNASGRTGPLYAGRP